MASIDWEMLALGLAIVWIGLGAYLVRLSARQTALERRLRSLRSTLTAARRSRRTEETE